SIAFGDGHVIPGCSSRSACSSKHTPVKFTPVENELPRQKSRGSGGLTRPNALGHVDERGDALDVEIGVEVVRVDEDGADAGGAGAVDVGAPRVTPGGGVGGGRPRAV